MKITPLEIRQKDFEKKLRGYDKDEVNAFLQSLSNEWERMLEENKDLNLKLQQAEREVKKLREVESSLYKTLKTAEDTGANVIEQANKAAELHMKETQMNAEALLNESKNKARAMIEQTEMESRQIIEELQDAVKKIQENHQEIENQRTIALQELKNLSVALIEKVELNTKETKEVRLEDYVQRVKQLARESEKRIKAEKTEITVETQKLETPEAGSQDVAKEQEPETVVAPESTSEPKEEETFLPPNTDDLKERMIRRQEERIDKREEDNVEPIASPQLEKEEPVIVTAEAAEEPKMEVVTEPQPVERTLLVDELLEHRAVDNLGDNADADPRQERHCHF